MGISYYKNAKTTVLMRRQIKESSETLEVLAKRLGLNKNTVFKWKNREDLEDRSCMPHKLNTVLSELDEWIICEVRKTAKIGIDELSEILKPFIPHINRYWVYLSMKFNKTAQSAEEFFKEIKVHHPYKIHTILTDNGKEFTGRFVRGKTKPSEHHSFDRECELHQIEHRLIEHRLTQPYTPKTNGMVEHFNRRIADILRDNHFYSYQQLAHVLKYYRQCYNFFNKQNC